MRPLPINVMISFKKKTRLLKLSSLYFVLAMHNARCRSSTSSVLAINYLNASKQNSTCTIPISQKWLHPTTYMDGAICSVRTLSTHNVTLFVIIKCVPEQIRPHKQHVTTVTHASLHVKDQGVRQRLSHRMNGVMGRTRRLNTRRC
jgi:hypothetical protein